LEQDDPDFAGIPKASMSLMKASLGMMGGEHYDVLTEYPALFLFVVVYVVATVVFLLNLLIAQLSCAYSATYEDMVGLARLNRCKIIYETIPSVSPKRWTRFVENLRLDERVEFGEGDLGITGGIQVMEPSNLNITTQDQIKRFGGSTSQEAVWPEEAGGDDEEDRFERMEKLIEKAMKRMSKGAKGGKSGTAGGSSSMNSGGESGGGDEEGSASKSEGE